MLYCALAAGAESTKPRLKLFGDRPNPHGLWKTELLEASDPALMANAKRMSRGGRLHGCRSRNRQGREAFRIGVHACGAQEHDRRVGDRDAMSRAADDRHDDEA